MSSTIDCPYCEAEHEPTGCHETDSSDWQCHKCERYFDVEIEYDPSYSTSKEPCRDGQCEFGEMSEWRNYGDQELRSATCEKCDKYKHESRKSNDQ